MCFIGRLRCVFRFGASLGVIQSEDTVGSGFEPKAYTVAMHRRESLLSGVEMVIADGNGEDAHVADDGKKR